MEKLVRALNLRQSVAINVIDMVGIGPFVTMPLIMGMLHGPYSLLAWLFGALLSFADGFVWSELGAKWPQAGGSYVFLQKLYGNTIRGRLMSFLYVWQTSIQAPLVIASGAIGFAQYFNYLYQLDAVQQKVVSGALVLFITWLLYRGIKTIGRISVVLGLVVIGTILWMIISGIGGFSSEMAFAIPDVSSDSSNSLMAVLGYASIKSVYSYLGYYNVCHLGGEIEQPERNIPRSIFVSIAIIAVLYISMQLVVLGNLPWQTAKDSEFLISTYFEKIYGPQAATLATALVLFIAFSSLFAVMLGYSRVPYSAAVDGNFFKVFAKIHPVKQFPTVSLLVLGGLGFIFSLLFKMKEVITAIIVMRILVQFVGQAVGLWMYKRHHASDTFPFKMPLFPLPIMLSIACWFYIFFSVEWWYIAGAIGVISVGAMVYFLALYPVHKKSVD